MTETETESDENEGTGDDGTIEEVTEPESDESNDADISYGEALSCPMGDMREHEHETKLREGRCDEVKKMMASEDAWETKKRDDVEEETAWAETAHIPSSYEEAETTMWAEAANVPSSEGQTWSESKSEGGEGGESGETSEGDTWGDGPGAMTALTLSPISAVTEESLVDNSILEI